MTGVCKKVTDILSLNLKVFKLCIYFAYFFPVICYDALRMTDLISKEVNCFCRSSANFDKKT